MRYDKNKIGRAGLILFFLVFAVNGCTTIKEKCKQVWGSSISHLESARKDGKAEDISLSVDDCFARTQVILEAAGANVYVKDKNKQYLAAMNFKGHVDTTQVGIFFTKKEERLTKVEIASMSPGLVDEVAELLFPELKK